MKGHVFWVTGLPGAGKTTIAKALYSRLKPGRPELVYLDGDMMRQVFGNFQYDPASRKQLALSYSRMCSLLSEQGHDVICATVSMFHEVHEWNRQHLNHYHEIYLDVPFDVLHRRNQKDLYRKASEGQAKNVYGIDIAFEKPQCPDIVIHNDGNIEVDSIVESLMEKLL